MKKNHLSTMNNNKNHLTNNFMVKICAFYIASLRLMNRQNVNTETDQN